MYEDYWGLEEKPFENTPNPRFLYRTQNCQACLTRLFYAVTEEKTGALLTGDYGCGKTLMSRALIQQLDRDRYELALIVSPSREPEELLEQILMEFGVEHIGFRRNELLQAINETLLNNFKADKHTVIIVDEAHLINDEYALEELRLLLNFQLNEKSLITLILIAHSEFRKRLNSMQQLKQRLAMKCHLNPLSNEETGEYIKYRLQVAKAKREIFTDKAMDMIFTATNGIPREINNLCDICLLLGFMKKAEVVDEQIVEEATL